MAERTSFRRAATFFQNDMVQPLRQTILGRKLFANTVDLPAGKFEMDYDTVTEMGSAIVTYDLPDESVKRDMVAVAASNLKLAVISKGWTIPRSQWDAYLTEGKNLSTTASRSAGQVIGLAEDDLLIQSWKPDGTTARINGLYASAGNTDSTSADVGTYGNAVIAAAAGLAKMAEDNVPTTSINWNWTLNPTQYYKIMDSVSTGGVYELEQLMRVLNPTGGAQGGLFMSNDITAGTGLLSPVDPAGTYISLVRGKDLTVVIGEDSKIPDISPIYGTAYEIVAPWVKQSVALCTTTGI